MCSPVWALWIELAIVAGRYPDRRPETKRALRALMLFSETLAPGMPPVMRASVAIAAAMAGAALFPPAVHATVAGRDGLIAFTRAVASEPGQIYLVRPNGHGLRRLTHRRQGAGGAAWSPDGRRIVFSSAGRGGGVQVYVTKAAMEPCMTPQIESGHAVVTPHPPRATSSSYTRTPRSPQLRTVDRGQVALVARWRLPRTRHAKESPGGGRRVDRRRA